jgi:hypothetical protein
MLLVVVIGLPLIDASQIDLGRPTVAAEQPRGGHQPSASNQKTREVPFYRKLVPLRETRELSPGEPSAVG